MSKDTTDELREQIYKIFRELGVPSADSGGMEKPYVIEAADEVLALISNREKLARLERGIYELERLHHIPQMFGDWENVIDDRIATLRKELDGGQR